MTDVGNDTPVYPIGVVRKLTSLSDRQIRYYEQVGLLRPARSPGKRRMYSQQEVETLRRIKMEMERGLRTDEIREKLGLGRASHDRPTSPPVRGQLPHYAGGEPLADAEPDVETRRAFMARRGPREDG